ncbi:MAG TPA: FAD-linked oxidase C-terminal domain-containing protein [Actinomycetota bacterium]|nr:FAD-linked oxidase C-terminal domain-containing protein [Actinomycetota bacterium]
MADVDAARRALEEALGPAEVLSDPLALAVYARDASMLEGGCALVAFPRTVEHIVTCVRVAAEHDLPVVPRGAGTGLAGGATPTDDALVVVTAKMDRILEVRPDDRLAWVEPGVVTLDLVAAVEPHGLTFAPDPSSRQSSTIGGNVATNAGGPHCLASGTTANHVLALDLVLPDGSVERLGSEGPTAPGYDLRAAVVGSEGTLGIVAAACVRLTPIPPAVRTLLLDFTDVEDCAATVSGIIAAGVVPAAIELMDRPIVEAVERFVHAGYPVDAAAVLIVEVDGTEAATRAQTDVVEHVAREHGVRTIRVASDATDRDRLWRGRRNALGAVGRIAPHYTLHDIVVPRTRLAEALSAIAEIARRHDLPVTCNAHAGDGNLHPHLHFDARQTGALERALAAGAEIVRLAVEMGGTLSGEHGVGLEKRDALPLVWTDEDVAAQACVRSAFDPERRMNPHKVLPEGARCGEPTVLGPVPAASAASLREDAWS